MNQPYYDRLTPQATGDANQLEDQLSIQPQQTVNQPTAIVVENYDDDYDIFARPWDFHQYRSYEDYLVALYHGLERLDPDIDFDSFLRDTILTDPYHEAPHSPHTGPQWSPDIDTPMSFDYFQFQPGNAFLTPPDPYLSGSFSSANVSADSSQDIPSPSMSPFTLEAGSSQDIPLPSVSPFDLEAGSSRDMSSPSVSPFNSEGSSTSPSYFDNTPQSSSLASHPPTSAEVSSSHLLPPTPPAIHQGQYIHSAPPSPYFTAMSSTFNSMAISSNDHGGNPSGHSRVWHSDDYGHLMLPDPMIPMRRSASESSRHVPRRPDSDFASGPGNSSAESSHQQHQQQQQPQARLSRSNSRTRHRHSLVDSQGVSVDPETRIVKKKVVTSPNIKAAAEQRRIHDARFNCDVEDCESTFTTRNKLERHLDAHEGIKAYQCTIEGCERRFSSVSDRKRHETTSKMHQLQQSGDPRGWP